QNQINDLFFPVKSCSPDQTRNKEGFDRRRHPAAADFEEPGGTNCPLMGVWLQLCLARRKWHSRSPTVIRHASSPRISKHQRIEKGPRLFCHEREAYAPNHGSGSAASRLLRFGSHRAHRFRSCHAFFLLQNVPLGGSSRESVFA